MAGNLFLGDPQLGQHLLVRDAFIVLQPLAGLIQGGNRFWAELFLFYVSMDDRTRDRVKNCFEQAGNGGQLGRREPVDEFMDVLPGISHTLPFFLVTHPQVAVNAAGKT